MKTALSKHSDAVHFGLHLVQMLAFRVELCANDLYLVDGFWGVAKLAWWSKTVRVWRRSKPKLVDGRKCQVQFDFVLGAFFA
jgi:hypothetical protein